MTTSPARPSNNGTMGVVRGEGWGGGGETNTELKLIPVVKLLKDKHSRVHIHVCLKPSNL
jgi:hypothetical protein